MNKLPPKEAYERFVQNMIEEEPDPALYDVLLTAYHSLPSSLSYDPKFLRAVVELTKETYRDYTEAVRQSSYLGVVSFEQYRFIMFSGILLGQRIVKRGL